MPPTMTTQSAGRPAATSRGGGTGGRAGSGGGRTRGRFGDQEILGIRTAMLSMTTSGVMAGHAAYTDRFHELAWLVPHLVTPEGKRIERYMYGLDLQIRGMVAATKPKTIQKTVQIAGTLTDEALRNGSIKKNPKKRGNGG
ncbi:hypothetical protein Tco_0542567 [Tanacetum coccineum]